MGSMALQLKPFTGGGVFEGYERAMSLRDLVDQRRYNALRRQEIEQKILEGEEERQQAQSLRQLFSTNPKPTMQQVINAAPGSLGFRTISEMRQAQSAAETAQTAALTRRQTLEAVQQRFRERYLNAVTAIARDKDPARRAALYPQLQADLRKEAGEYLTPALDAFISQPLPDDEDEILNVYAAVHGADKLQTLLNQRAAESRAKAEEARKRVQFANQAAAEMRAQQTHAAELPGKQAKALGEQYELASRFTPNVTDQASYDKLLAMLPEEERRKWPSVYSPNAVRMIANAGMTAAQRTTAERQAVPNTAFEAAYAATDPNLPPEQRAQQALKTMERHAQLSRPQINVAMPGYGSATSTLSGEDFLKTLSPGVSATVKGISEGRIAMPPAGSRAAGAQQLRTAVMQYDPGFSEQRAQVRKAFTTGKEAQNIGALNTAIVHLGRLAHAAEALETGTFTPANEMYQYFADKFGSATVTNFALLKDAVAGEMAAALKGNATDIEIANMKSSIRASNSPTQMLGVVKEGMGILSDKARTYDDRYHREMPGDPWSPILPSATDTLNNFAVPYTRKIEQPTAAPKKRRVWNEKKGRFEER